MQTPFWSGCLLLLLVMPVIHAHGQAADSLPNRDDSLATIRQWVSQEVLQQLQKTVGWQSVQDHKLSILLKDSTVMDSLCRLLIIQLNKIGNTAGRASKAIITESAASAKQLLQQQIGHLLQTQQLKALFNQFTGILHQPVVQWKGGSASIIGQTAPSLFNTGIVFINTATLSSNWAVLGIPMALQFSRQDFTGRDYRLRNIFSFRFNREAYLHSLRDQVKLKTKAADLLPGYQDALQKIKQETLSRLMGALDSINMAYKGFLGSQLSQIGDPETLLKIDVGALRDKLLPADFLRHIEDQKNQLAMLQQQLALGGKPDMVLYDSLLHSVQSFAGINGIIGKINSFREDVRASGLLEKLQQAEQMNNSSMQQWLQEPDKLKSLAKEQLNLSGLQKIFLNLNQLQMGMNTVCQSPLTVNQYTSSGVNAEFINNKTYLFIMAGKQKEFGSLYDNRFAGPAFLKDNTGMGIRLGRGELQNSHTHFSFFSYRQQKSSYDNTVFNTVPGKTTVITFSNQLKINESNFLNVEVSKSTHKYDNRENIPDSLIRGGSLSHQSPPEEPFIQQMAFTLQWNGELKDGQLSYDIHGTRIGKGYTNPGSLFLSAGMTELGGSVKKSLFKNQLQLAARGSYRDYAYGAGNGSSWRTHSFSFQSKWRLKKGQWIALRYQPYQSFRTQQHETAAVGASNRLSLDMNIRRRFGKINYQQVISLAVLKSNYRFNSLPAGNHSILISSLQTFTINKRSYYFNTQYNNATASAASAAFGDQLDMDAGFMYKLGRNISASTALNYNSIKDWYRQAGIKQGISGQWGENCILSFYTAIFKNIKVYRPGSVENLRLDWRLQYLLK